MLLLLLSPPIILQGQKQSADDIIDNLITGNNIFELKRNYPKYKDHLHPSLKAWTEVLLNYAKNQTDETLKAIQYLILNHQDSDFNNLMRAMILWGNILIKKGEYTQAYELMHNHLNNNSIENRTNLTLKEGLNLVFKRAKTLKGFPKSSIERSTTDCIVPLLESNKIVGQINGKDA